VLLFNEGGEEKSFESRGKNSERKEEIGAVD